MKAALDINTIDREFWVITMTNEVRGSIDVLTTEDQANIVFERELAHMAMHENIGSLTMHHVPARIYNVWRRKHYQIVEKGGPMTADLKSAEDKLPINLSYFGEK